MSGVVDAGKLSERLEVLELRETGPGIWAWEPARKTWGQVELDAGQKDAVKAKLLETSGYAKMEMHYEVDASIIGGMIIRIGGRVVDSSVRTKLDGLTKQLLQIQLG